MSQFPYGEQLLDEANVHGARGRDNSLLDVLTMQRKKMTWYSMRILKELGVPDKPKGTAECPLCNKKKTQFALDHMAPWRTYVAVYTGNAPGGVKVAGKQILVPRQVIKALYNDPDNLWWICEDCNSAKTDKIYDKLSQLQEIDSGNVPDGELARNIDTYTVVQQ